MTTKAGRPKKTANTMKEEEKKRKKRRKEKRINKKKESKTDLVGKDTN